MGQELASAVARTGHGLGNPTAQVMSDGMKDKVRETDATEI